MSRELQDWFRNLGQSLTTDIAQEWANAVEQELVQPIKAAAPVGETNHLQQSVQKVQGTLTSDGQHVLLANGTGANAGSTQWVVMAGGPLTTKPVKHPYGHDVDPEYDYALATEFGTSREPAHPFFWPTIRAHWPRLVRRAEEILTSRFAKL